MFKLHQLSAAALACACLAQPALAQSKAALGKTANEFHAISQSLAKSLEDLSKRATTASPNDKDMLKLVNTQLSLVDATADGVLALGVVAAEVRDSGDVAIVKKHLATRCTALKSLTDATAKYVGSLASNIAAVATAAEVNKARDTVAQMGASTLCNPTPGKG